MPLDISVARLGDATDTPLLAILLGAGESLPASLAQVDTALGGSIARSISRRDFRGTRDETLHLAGAERGVQRVLLVGYGSGERPNALRRAAAIAARQAGRLGSGALHVVASGVDEAAAEAIAFGLAVGSWEFTEMKTPPPEEERRAPLGSATIFADDTAAAEAGVRTGVAIGAGHSLARRLGMLPGNICTPEYLAQASREVGERHGMKVSVMGREELTREKMGSFLAVAQGTVQDPKLITIEYAGGAKGQQPVVLIGKGLCFDTGGVSIKPAQGMEWMKFDMSGAGGVIGAMDAIGRLGLKINVVGIIGSTTNVVSDTAIRPGDVVQASNGKFIEIINTDAEGRLVLADLLVYARRFNPAAAVDAATLTGACVIALGHTASGVLGSDDALVEEVVAAGRRAGEPGWPLPLWDDFKELIKSDIADIKNAGGRAAGTISAAMFLKEFVDGFPWAHLDVAGTAYTETDLGAIPRGPTGVPVGTFVEFVRARAR